MTDSDSQFPEQGTAREGSDSAGPPRVWPHQRAMVDWSLERAGSMWACDMGTGKSRAAIELMRELDWPKTLIVAPKTVVRNVWPHQFELWAQDVDLYLGIIDDKITARGGKSAGQRRIAIAQACDIVIINYESIFRDPFGEWLVKQEDFFGLLILDESHRIKTPAGKASRFISRLSNRIPKRLAMTGTPLPHSPMDIYAQFRALDKNKFGTNAQLFRSRYAEYGGHDGKQIVRWRHKKEMRRIFESVAYQVSAEDVLTLPDVVDSTHKVELNKRARNLIEEAEEEFFLELESGVITIQNALVKLLRLQQITSGYLHPEGGQLEVFDTAKRDALEAILSDIGETHIVVFCRFRQDLETINAAAVSSDYEAYEISGTVKQLDEWNENGGVLAVQIQAGGLGIDLTKARTSIYYSLGFSLGDYLQSRARVHRPGQTRSVHYIHLVASGTIDMRILNSLRKKFDVVREIVTGKQEQAEGFLDEESE